MTVDFIKRQKFSHSGCLVFILYFKRYNSSVGPQLSGADTDILKRGFPTKDKGRVPTICPHSNALIGQKKGGVPTPRTPLDLPMVLGSKEWKELSLFVFFKLENLYQYDTICDHVSDEEGVGLLSLF